MATLRSMFEGKIDLTDPESWDAARVQQWEQVAGDLNQPLFGDPDFPIDITVPPPAMYLDDLDPLPGGTHNFSRKPQPGYTPGQTQNFPRKPRPVPIDTSGWDIPAAPIGMTGTLSTMGITGLMATEDVQQFIPPPSDYLYIPTFGAFEPEGPGIDLTGVQVDFAQPWQPPEPVGPVRQSVLDEAHYYASIKPQGPTAQVTMPPVAGNLLAPPRPEEPRSPNAFFEDIEILPGGMALPGSPLDNFMDWVREGLREAPGNYYGDAQLAAMQQARVAGMGLAGASPGPGTNPFAEYSRAYDENPDAHWQDRFSAGGEAFFGSVGAWIGHGAGQAGNAIMNSPVGEPVTWAMWNWGKVDDLAIAPTPALLGFSAVETVWGPWEARERWIATPESQGLLEAAGDATPAMIRERYDAVREQYGRAMANEWLADYEQQQAQRRAVDGALVPMLQEGGWGAVGDYFSRSWQGLSGYAEQVPQAYEAMKTARNPYTYGIFPSDPRYEEFKQVPFGAYGGWNADLSRNMPIEATYTQFANWIVTKPQQIEQALHFAEVVDLYASSETDVGYEPEQLKLMAAQARAEATQLQNMGPEDWIDQNISLTSRVGYNLAFDWTNLVSWGMDAFGLSGSAMRAARASQGVLGVDEAASAANVAGGKVVDLADDGYQVLQGGFLPYAFDARRRLYYPDVKLREAEAAAVGITTDAASKTAYVEAKNISLAAAAGVAAPSMEDDALGTLAAGRSLSDDMLTVDELLDLAESYDDVATVAAELAGYADPMEWYYTPRRVTNMPAEVRNLQLPQAFFEDPSLHRLMDTQATDRLRGYLGRNWMEFQTSSGAPVFEAADIYGRIAQREDTWGIAAGIMQQADEAISAGGAGVVQLSPELLGNGAQLWEVLGNVQGLAAHGEWSMRGTPADILATGRIEIVPGQLVGRELHEMQTTMSNVELLKRIETELAGYSGASTLTAREQLDLVELQHMRQSVIGQSDLSWADFFNTLSPEARRVTGELGHTQYTELVNRVGGTSIIRLDWGDVDQIVPSKDLYSTFDRSVLAADALIQDAVRSEWDVYRAGLAGRAEKFQAASWLYEQFAAGSLPELQAFMATVDDLATARAADQLMEASDFGYHIDWQSMTVGKGGTRVQIVPGAAGQPSVMRSAEPWLQTRVTQAFGTSHPTMTDIALRGYGQEVLDTLETGGVGIYLAGVEDARMAYRQISDVAAEAGLGVDVLEVDQGGFSYRLGPLGEGAEPYGQLAAFDERFPGKTSSAFAWIPGSAEDFYRRNREAMRAGWPRNFWDVIPFVDDVQEAAEEAAPVVVRSRAETEARLAAIRAEEELGRDLGPLRGQVVEPADVLAGPTGGEMVYVVPRPGTWYINNKGDLVFKPQSRWVSDPTAKSGRKWEAGFTFYTDPAGAVQGTPYEDLFGTPQQAWRNANPRVGREYRWGGQTVEPPASLGWSDDIEIERGILGVDEETLDFSNRVYDNPVDVGGIEDLYWFQSPDDTSLPMSRPRSPYNPLIPKADLAFYTEEGNEGLFYAENLAQYQASAERGLTSSTSALNKAQQEQRAALLEIQAMRKQIDDLYRSPYGEVGQAADYIAPREANAAAMEMRAELRLMEAEYAGKYGSRPPQNEALALSYLEPKTQYSGGEYGAIGAALADYPIIAIPRDVFEQGVTGARTQYGDPLFSSKAAGDNSISLVTRTRSDPFSIPSGGYTIGTTAPGALPTQTSSTGTGYEAFVGDLYRRGAALAQSLSEDTRYQLYRDHILGALGFENRKGEGLWAEGPVQIPAGPVRPGGSVFDVLSPEDYLPKGVAAIPDSVPVGDMPEVARAGMVGTALKAENWKSYAITTGAWHEPAETSWKSHVPWWMRHYGNQYYPSNEAGLREMLGTLLSRAPDEIPQELVDNPGLLKDYQLLAGTALGYDTSEWDLTFGGYTTSMNLSSKELDPTYWPAMGAVRGNEWASDIPLNVRERIQADWVREMESFQVIPRGQDWYRDYRSAFMGGSRVQGPAPYPGSPAAADAGFMTREFDANLVADWGIDAMKRAADAVKKLGFTREAQAGRELWQDLLPGLMERIDFSPVQVNRDFWAAVDKTAMAYADVPTWMEDLSLRVQEARAGFERFLYGDEPLWAFQGPYNPRANVPVVRAGDPFDWLMERIDRLSPEQAAAARAIMTTPASNLDDVASLSGRSIIDEMRAFLPSDLIDEFNAEFSPVPGAPAAAAPAAPAPTVQGPMSIPVGDELPPFVPGSGDIDGNFYLAQARGYTGAPPAATPVPVSGELPPLVEGDDQIFGVFENRGGRRLSGPQSLPAGGTARLSTAQQQALGEIERLRQEAAAAIAAATSPGAPAQQYRRARNLAQQLNALETEYAARYGGEQADIFASSGTKSRPAPLRDVQEIPADWDPAQDPVWASWGIGNYVAGAQQSRPMGPAPMPEPPAWLDDEGLVAMHGGFGFFGAQPPKGRISDFSRATRKYEMAPDISEYGFVSYADALAAGRLDILEEQLALRSAEGYLTWGVGGESRSHIWPEYQYGQTFLQRMGPESREFVSWTGNEIGDASSTYQIRPGMLAAAADAPRASMDASADVPLKIQLLYGEGGKRTFEKTEDALAFANWLDTVAEPVPLSFYGPPLGAAYNEAGDMLVLEEQRQGLIALGYGDEDMAAMTAMDAEYLLNKGKRKSGTYARRTDNPTGWVMEERRGQMSTPAAADNLEEGPVTYSSPAAEPSSVLAEEPVSYDASPSTPAAAAGGSGAGQPPQEPPPGDDTVPFDYEPLPGEQDSAGWPMTGVQDMTGGRPPMSLPFTRSEFSRSQYYDPNAPLWQQVEQMGGGAWEWGEPYWMQDMPAYRKGPAMVEPGPLTFEEFERVARQDPGPTTRNTQINPADWGFSPDPYEEMTIVSGLGIEEAREVKELYPGSIVRFQRRTARGQYGYRVAENGEILPVFNRAPGQVDDGDIYEVVMPQVATEMPPAWPELKFDQDGELIYGQRSEGRLWPKKEKDPTFDLEAWLAEKAERERQVREWYMSTYLPEQQAAGNTDIRTVNYFLGLYAGSDMQTWAGFGDDLTFRHAPEAPSTYSGGGGAMPPGGFSALGPQGVVEAQDLLSLLAAEGIDAAANEAALVEAINNLVGGAAGAAQNIGSSQGGWQGFINRIFSFVGGGGSLGGGGGGSLGGGGGGSLGGAPPAAAAAAMPPGGSAQPFLTNLTQPWQAPLLYGPPKGPPLAPGGEYAEVAGPGSRVEWSQDLSQLRRYGELDDPWRDLVPWGASRGTRAVRAVEEFDLLGTLLTGTGAGSDELAVLVNQLVLDPASLITGIDAALLPKLASQADAQGIWRLGAGALGNMDMARALPLLTYAGNDLVDFAARLGSHYYGAEVDFNQFQDIWGQIFTSASERYFGTGLGDNKAWKAVQAAGDVQRAILAEANLSLNPQVWAGNAISANYINQIEGYGTFKTLEELEAGLSEQVGGHIARSRDTLNAPTVRTQGALEGRAVGSGAFLGLNSSSMLFRPRRWVDAAIDVTMGWWASDDLLKRVNEGLDAFAARFQNVSGPVQQPSLTAPYTRTRLDDLLSTDPGYHAWRERELGAGIEGPAPASSSDPAWTVLAGGTPNLSPGALRLANLGTVGAGQPGQVMGFRSLLEKYNPFAPFASISEGASNLWTGMTTTMAGRVPIGEQANYFRTFAQANNMARSYLLPDAFGPVVGRGEALFGADDPVLQALTGEYVRNQMLMSNRYEIGESLDAILQGMVDRTDPNYARYKDFIAKDMLGTFDEYNLSALKAAKAGSDNVMLEPSHKTNFDEWVSPVMAFAYFGMHNAYNWIGRSLRDPGPLRNFLLFERAATIQNENQDVPTRYEGMIEGPFGWYYSNPTTALTGGLNRLAPNPIGQEQLGEAETPQEALLAAAGTANLRFLPLYDAALRGDMSVPKLLGQFGWQFVAADQAMRSVGMHGIGVTTDEFTNYRAGRYLGAETLEGTYSPATGLMGQQVLYEEQWDVPEEYRSDQVAAAGNLVAGAAKQAVAAEELARTLVRTFLLPFSARPPVNEGELIGAQLSNQMQAVGPSAPGGSFQNMDVLKGENPAWYPWAARGLLYPESDERPQEQPIDNLEKVIPGGIPPTPSVPPPFGWEPPVWDTSWGRHMKGPQDSPYAEEDDTTALYVMVDPITGLIRYVGQSIHPSERYTQHLEQFAEDGFDHPKTKWEASLYAQGTYPQMYVFDWQPGTVADRNDEADKAEQRWIGFLRYEVGVGFEGTPTGDVNVDVPDESVWRALMEEAGQTPEMYWQIYRSWPETLDPVQLDKEPNIDWSKHSPFPGQPLSPEGILLLEANPPEKKTTGEDFATWIDGVTPETAAAMHAAGVTTWGELAAVADDPATLGAVVAATGKSADQVLKWSGYAATTVAIRKGQQPMQFPAPKAETPAAPAAPAAGAPATSTTSAPQSTTIASSGALGTSLAPSWMAPVQGKEPYRVYSEEQLTEGIARLSTLNQIAVSEGYGTSAMSRPQLQRSYEFAQDVTRTYPFKPSARDYLLDNVYTYVYDFEKKTGGGLYDGGNNVISLQTAQEEGAVHEMAHAYWQTLREDELGEGTYASALGVSLLAVGQQMQVSPDHYDPELAAMVEEYLVGNKEGTFGGFYGQEGDEAVDDHEIYAGLASWAMGDIDLLPESLRPYYEGLFEPSPSVNYREAYLESGDAYDNRGLIGQAVQVAAGGAPVVNVPPQSGLGASPAAGLGVPSPTVATGVPLDPGLAQKPYRPTTGPQASAPAGGLTGMAQRWLAAGQHALGNLFRLGQAANAQVGSFTTNVNQYLTMMERTGGEGSSGPVQVGPQVSTKYYYLPGWGATVRPGEEFWLPELPDGAQFWMPANMIRFRDSEGYPDPDYQNNPMFDRTQPDSFKRMQELYGPLQPVPLEYLMAEPAYMGPGSHTSLHQPRLVAGGRQGLQGNPYGVQGAGGMYTTIGAPDPRENPVEYANWQALIAEPRGDYGIWLDTPYSGSRTLTQGYGDNPESYARFGTAGHTGLDWSMKEGSEIYAAAPGMVTTVGYDEDGYGSYVIIGHDFGQTLYGHLGGVGVEQGQYLATGDLLGLSGNTGNSTGGHLHFELILAGGPDEFKGRVDPTPYLPGSGQPSAGGWLLTDMPGVGPELAAALVDAGITTPEQLAGLAPLPGQSAPPSTAELAHWLDVNVINQAGRDAIGAQQGWNLIAGARATLQMGPKPVKEKEGEGSAAATPGAYGVAQEGGTPLRPGVVAGLGEKTIETLKAAGITTFEQLSGERSGMSAEQWMEELTKLDDIGPTTAEKLVTGATVALASGTLEPMGGGPPPAKEGDRPLTPGLVDRVGASAIANLAALPTPITTVQQLAATSPDWLDANVKDFGPSTALAAYTSANEVVATPWDGSPDLEALPYVGEKKAAEMREAGYGTREGLEGVSPQRFAFDMGMSVEKAREVLNAFRAQAGLPELTPEMEAALQAKEGVTPQDFEWLKHIGKTNEEKLYTQGVLTEDALYGLGISGIKGALGITDAKALEVYNELRVKRGEEPIATVQEARDASDPKIAVGQEAGMLGVTGATNDQQILLQAHNIQTLQELIDEDPDDIATWLGTEKGQAETLQERARKDIAARGGGTYFDPDALQTPGASPYAAGRTLGPLRDTAAVAAGWRRVLREDTEVDEEELDPKLDRRLDLGDTVEKLQAKTEDPGTKAVEVVAAKKPEAFSRENKSGSGGAGVNLDELEAKLLERLRGRLTREVFSEFEKVLAV